MSVDQEYFSHHNLTTFQTVIHLSTRDNEETGRTLIRALTMRINWAGILWAMQYNVWRYETLRIEYTYLSYLLNAYQMLYSQI